MFFFTLPPIQHTTTAFKPCVTLRVVASSRGPSRVQAALGQCERRAALLVSGCLLTVGAFALPALAGIMLLQCCGLVLRSLSCGSTSRHDKLQLCWRALPVLALSRSVVGTLKPMRAVRVPRS